MVIVNPKLSLPIDLPYKKRQRPFHPNSQLQQATIRYNEAIRKKYNDIQFANRCEQGFISPNELTSVNTVDVGKEIDPDLLAEVNALNPPPFRHSKHRKFKRGDINSDSGRSGNDNRTNITYNCSGPMTRSLMESNQQHHVTTNNMMPEVNNNNNVPQYDCNNIEMFPPLSSTVELHSDNNSKSATPYYSRAAIRHSKSTGQSPRPGQTSVQTLETQAIKEYQPTVDSAHDMIFGNVMGIDYGNFIHDRLWPTQFNNSSYAPHFIHPQQQFQPVNAPIPCNVSKSVGYNLPLMSAATYANVREIGNVNEFGTGDVGQRAMSTSPTGSSRRSTSVPRPRAESRKETLKQAAIRCGIIKGTVPVPVPAIPKQRSHYLVPLQLPALPSDPLVPVVEILHPRTLIPTCSSEALLDEMKHKIADAELKNDGVEAHGTKSTVDLQNNNPSPEVVGECGGGY